MTRHRRILHIATCVLIAAVAVALPGRALLAQPGKVEVLWLGQAAFKITTTTGKVIVIDPFLTKNPKTPAEYKDLAKLGKVDLILVTHGHGDHVGDVKELAALTKAKVYGKVHPLGPQITITQVRAEHSSEVTVTDPATKKSTTHPGGEPAGFIIEMENGLKIYHMGDTGIFGDMRLIADYYKPDLILMPIGGHFVMDPVDAAYVTREWLKPRFVIPIHYGTFPVLKGTPQEYMAALGQTTTKVFPINPGDKLEF
jgi:L-ascorbate metabolism protein UlaG (beta-lactamase superfamily)